MRIQELAWAGTGAAVVSAAAVVGAPTWLTALLAAATTWLAVAARGAPRATPTIAAADLRQGYATTPAEVEEFLDQASLAARHLGFLVNDVLDEAALAAGQLRLHCEDQSVHDLLGAARDLLGTQARLRGIDLRFEEIGADAVVHTDERRFLQILVNLVGNALKFTESGEVVRVRVESRGTVVRFVVEDRGAGVPLEARARLFTPFGCAASAPGVAIPGTGLGLHVCKLLVEQLGGTIAYEPAADRGSVFWFELPTARGATVADSTIAETGGQAR
jgi:signal transduction histidine kinase